MITPLFFFGLMVLVTATGMTVNAIQHRRVHVRMLELAEELNMAYSQSDRFGLADRVADHFPVPGAAALRVLDLFYVSEKGGYRYLFSAEYSLGVVRAKHREVRAASLVEARGSGDASWKTLQVAPADLPLIEQYRFLAGKQSA